MESARESIGKDKLSICAALPGANLRCQLAIMWDEVQRPGHRDSALRIRRSSQRTLAKIYLNVFIGSPGSHRLGKWHMPGTS
jgi:hypothetical protein